MNYVITHSDIYHYFISTLLIESYSIVIFHIFHTILNWLKYTNLDFTATGIWLYIFEYFREFKIYRAMYAIEVNRFTMMHVISQKISQCPMEKFWSRIFRWSRFLSRSLMWISSSPSIFVHKSKGKLDFHKPFMPLNIHQIEFCFLSTWKSTCSCCC